MTLSFQDKTCIKYIIIYGLFILLGISDDRNHRGFLHLSKKRQAQFKTETEI